MNRQEEGDPDLEKQADELAAEILMPTSVVNQFVDQSKIGKDHIISHEFIQVISKKFNVSPLVAVIRLRKLKYHVPYIEFA